MMLHEDLVRELVTELYKMDVAELLEFKEDEATGLELQGIPKEIRDHCIHIIDVVIQVKQERMGATV
ncbi:MAG: hypothetical protein ACLUKO_05190 [Enterocloster bolteae]|jgi:hypothetical protein|uniref:Uncharacterized protein n=2 Tax=root TaxID=1 RepID=A0A414ASC9_9FIRM|nr:hypothetical protein [Enterocloster bolteae]MDU3289434.1 hypothetical protein [Enterocloster bolteae]RHC54408.1 hypothetical protein DW839_19480 [Enterocloster bolteae]DAE14355.1 MAG TPA: hypothetical protein [Siphoviridae sp. ct8HH20]